MDVEIRFPWELGVEVSKKTEKNQTLYVLSDSDSGDVGRITLSEASDTIRLHTIFVKPGYRGKGYGKTLMETVLLDYREKRFSLCTGLGNIGFFERFNFKVCREGFSDSLFEMIREPF